MVSFIGVGLIFKPVQRFFQGLDLHFAIFFALTFLQNKMNGKQISSSTRYLRVSFSSLLFFFFFIIVLRIFKEEFSNQKQKRLEEIITTLDLNAHFIHILFCSYVQDFKFPDDIFHRNREIHKKYGYGLFCLLALTDHIPNLWLCSYKHVKSFVNRTYFALS